MIYHHMDQNCPKIAQKWAKCVFFDFSIINMSITCLKGAVYRIWSRSVHFEKIGKKSAKIRPTFGSNNAACRTGTQVAKKNKRRRKLSAFQRGMSWHSPIKTQGARADLVLESLAKKVEKKTKKKFGKNVPLGTLYQHAKGELAPTTFTIWKVWC